MTAQVSMWTPLQQMPWKFQGRAKIDGRELYMWTRSTAWQTDIHTIPVDEFWPAPKPTVRPGSIIDRIAEYFGLRPAHPGTQQDYAPAKGGPR